jgi:hydroxypyruvate reductase
MLGVCFMANIDEKRLGRQDLSAAMERRARIALQQIYQAAIRAAQPSQLLKQKLRISQRALIIESVKGRCEFPLTGKVYLIGVGKGVDLTAQAWEDLLDERLEQGVFLVRERLCPSRLERSSILVGGHPLPDQASLIGTQRCLELLRGAKRDDCVIFFLMGGASSLLAQPAPGLTLADKRAVAAALLKSGMAIAEINCVRKHLSSIKAGGLLRSAYPARVITLAISDVIGDDPTVIGSAPTFYDRTTFAHAWDVLKSYRLLNEIPKRVRAFLLRGIRGEIPETLKPASSLSSRNPYVLLANNRDALAAAKEKAESLRYGATILTTQLSGDTQVRAREICSTLKRKNIGKKRHRRPHCFLLGGETTVRVLGKGKGGRNQEFALASAIELRGSPGIYLLSAGSDGSDGPTDAAGAFADGRTFAKAQLLGIDPFGALRDNDSYHFFDRLGDLFRPGATGTNVLDFRFFLLH